MPWRVFLILVSDLHHVLALRRLNEVQAISHALMVSLDDDDTGRSRSQTEALTDTAFPTIPSTG